MEHLEFESKENSRHWTVKLQRVLRRDAVAANVLTGDRVSSRRATSWASPAQQALWRSCHFIEVRVSLEVHHTQNILANGEGAIDSVDR
jgi:hypothetical protein